ncbi:hypothetical protein NQZ68_008821 [Dissostichus eleginoides]|nr:hypothetical protein NQZ68_008821 [Dissostichus eleginoides]
MDVCLPGPVDVLLVDSIHSAADGVEVIRTSEGLCRSSREQLSLSVQPQHLRLWIPASRLTLENHFTHGFSHVDNRPGDGTKRTESLEVLKVGHRLDMLMLACLAKSWMYLKNWIERWRRGLVNSYESYSWHIMHK